MKIAFILPGRGHSGGVRVTVVAANYLRDRGHDVRILYRRPPITLRRMARSIWTNLMHAEAPEWVNRFNGETAAYRDLTQVDFDKKAIVVGVGMWSSGQLARLKIENPKLQYIHGASPWKPELMEQALPLPFPKIVVASNLKPLVESFGGGKVLAVIPNGIEPREYFNSVDTPQKNGIGTIYSSHPAKDPQTTLAVLDKLSKHVPNVPIRVFGGGRAPRKNFGGSYRRLPSIEGAREIYSRSRVWIVASRSEGFSVPVLEAMACGCAVVATDCGGTRDTVVDGENGFIVNVGNVQQIVDRVLLLLNDETLRARMCRTAEETVKKFSWDKSIDQLENVLKTLAP